MEWIEIRWTSGSLDEARRVARYLVQERWVASAQIIPWVEALYMWNNQLETAQESQIIFKTIKDNYKKIEEIIRQNSSYEIPEIFVTTIESGYENYLNWLQESVQRPAEERADQ